MKNVCEVNSDLIEEFEKESENIKLEKEKHHKLKLEIVDQYLEATRKILFLSTGCVNENNEMYRKWRVSNKGGLPFYFYLQGFLEKCRGFIDSKSEDEIHSPYFILRNSVYGDYYVQGFNRITKELFGVEYNLIESGDYIFDFNYYLVSENVTPKEVYEFEDYTPVKLENKVLLLILGIPTLGMTWLFLLLYFVWYVYLHVKYNHTSLYKPCRSFKDLR